MPDSNPARDVARISRYMTTADAACYFGVCTKTFRRMIAALPQRCRPAQRQWPGTTARRWDITELDAAFNGSHSSGWGRARRRGDVGQRVG